MRIDQDWSMEEKLVEIASQSYMAHHIMVEDVSLAPNEWDLLEKSLGSLIHRISRGGEVGIRLHGNSNIIRVWKRENKE